MLIAERISVRQVSLDIALCRPYCCTTVDMAFVTLRATASRTGTSASYRFAAIRGELMYWCTPCLRVISFLSNRKLSSEKGILGLFSATSHYPCWLNSAGV